MRSRLAFTILAIVGFVGCGSKSESTITGTVKFKGKPLNTGYVLFQFDDANTVNGTIGIDGKYSIRTPLNGHAKIAVGCPKPPPIQDLDKRGGPPVDLSKLPDPAKWVPIPDKFADPNTSGKVADLKSGNNSIDIDLE